MYPFDKTAVLDFKTHLGSLLGKDFLLSAYVLCFHSPVFIHVVLNVHSPTCSSPSMCSPSMCSPSTKYIHIWCVG